MSQTSLFGLFLSMTLGVAGAFTSGTTQITLLTAAGCCIVSVALSTLVDSRGNRARAEARVAAQALRRQNVGRAPQ